MDEIAYIIDKAERMINGATPNNMHVTRAWLGLAIKRLHQLNAKNSFHWVHETCEHLERSSVS